MPTIAEVMTLDPASVQAHQSLADAATALYEADCGSLPVVDDKGQLLGMVTDRDITMCGAIQGRTLHELPVRAAMTEDAVSIAPDASLSAAHKVLRERHVRRLPVIDASGVVVGMLSLTDLVRDAAKSPSARGKVKDVRDTIAEMARSWSDIEADGKATPAKGKAKAGKTSKPATHVKRAAKPAAAKAASAKSTKTAKAKATTVKAAAKPKTTAKRAVKKAAKGKRTTRA